MINAGIVEGDKVIVDRSLNASNQDIVVAVEQRRLRRGPQWLGLPVCVGIGPTKTLTKLANHMAKKKI